ncbi:MAG: NAD(P)/FAD-dependent oxidoreductase [Gammaproteobacteria bacterium]|nr:NAD(P)/FAD-dependent oxidoreductase [Gammaproteobacteria bacterium]
MPDIYDVIVIGAGHNGLTAAAYLARAGRRVLVLERRHLVGGCAVTEELWPGFRISRASYVAGLLRPAVIDELRLAEHGLTLLPRNPSSFTVEPDSRGLVLGPDPGACREEIRYYSNADARRYPQYEKFLEQIAQTVDPLIDMPPPDPEGLGWQDMQTLFATFGRGVRLGARLPSVLRMLNGAAAPILTSWFDSEPLLTTLATDAIIGAWAAPSTPGTGYVLLHHVMGETHGNRGTWAYARGGMGAISNALAAAAREHGVDIRCNARVERIRTRDGRATGVVLDGGEEIDAAIVVSNADPKVTLLDLLGPEDLPEHVGGGIEQLDFRSPVMKINVALDRRPAFAARPGAGQELCGTIHLGATRMQALEDSFTAARAGRLPRRPMIEMTIPSTLDDSLAPPGKHVASLFVQHVPYTLRDADWEQARDEFADRVFSIVDEVAPGFSDSVIHRDVLAPPDLERVFGITGGNIFHGAMMPDRLFFKRPLPALRRYRTPVDGLYMCGAGMHPGGGVMGACGRNAAGVILADS